MNATVREALISAGWTEGRDVDASRWIRPLEAEGFEIHRHARSILKEFGGLTVRSPSKDRVDMISFDPYDAASGLADEAESLSREYGEKVSPVGMWSGQYVAYAFESGRVIAIGPGWDWELGESLEETLELIVLGGRDVKCIKSRIPGGGPFPAE